MKKSSPVPREWLADLVTNWRELRDAYGSAAVVPDLLDQARAVTDWGTPVWNELWGRLCHQGTVSSASFAALPLLTDIAASRPELPLDPALFLAASIFASTDGPPEMTQARHRYATEAQALREIAERKLNLVESRGDILYSLQNLAAFEDLSVWQRHLDGLVNEELELDCPSCDEHLYLEVVGEHLVLCADPDLVEDGGRLETKAPAAFTAEQARLVSLCRSLGRTAIVQELLQLFGQATCPYCGATFGLDHALS